MRSSRTDEVVRREERRLPGGELCGKSAFLPGHLGPPSSGQSKQLGADPTYPTSKHLAKGHGRHGGEEGDSQGGDRILALGHGEGGDHASTDTGHGQLGHDRGAAVHLGVHE